MKRISILFAVLMLFVAGCNSDGQKTSVDADETAPTVNGDDIPLGDLPDGSEGEDSDGDTSTDGPETPSTEIEKRTKTARNAISRPVSLMTSSLSIGNIVLYKKVNHRFQAIGGSTAYKWSLKGNPAGTSLVVDENTKYAHFEGTPDDKLGKYSMELTCEDANKPEDKQTKKIEVTLREEIALNLYKKGPDGKWKMVGTDDTNADDPRNYKMILAKDEWLKVRVISAIATGDQAVHGDSYTWYLYDKEITCNEDNCKDEYRSMKIQSKDPLNPESKTVDSVMYIQTTDYEKDTFFDLSEISVKDALGNEAYLNIAGIESGRSMTVIFERDPCLKPLSFANKKSEVIYPQMVGAKMKERKISTQIAFKLEGGSGKITGNTDEPATGTATSIMDVVITPDNHNGEEGGFTYYIESQIHAGTPMEKFTDSSTELKQKIKFHDETCGTDIDALITIQYKMDDNLEFDRDDLTHIAMGGANDTDNEGHYMKVWFLNKSDQKTAEWEDEVDLDYAIGDNGPCDYAADDDCSIYIDVPDIEFKAKGTQKTSLKDFAVIHVKTDGDQDMFEYLDFDLDKYDICIGSWVGKLKNKIESSDCGDGDWWDVNDVCEWERDIVWSVKEDDYDCEELDDENRG